MSMLARTDPAKHAAISHKVQLAMAGAQAIEQERAAKAQWEQQQFQQWSKNEDKALLSKAPELADRDVSAKTAKISLQALHNVGFTDQELGAAWHGASNIAMRDHRVQLLILKAARYDEARAGVGRPAAKPVPPVQKPGVAPTDYAADVGEIQNLRRELRGATGQRALKIAAKLHGAERRARG
jgi:hypothetical protein